MVIVLTLIATLVISFVVVSLLIRTQKVAYPFDKERVKKLLHDIVAGQAHESEWQLFIGMPIRHDAQLEQIRLSCARLDEEAHIGQVGNRPPGQFLTHAGVKQVALWLRELEQSRQVPF